MEKVQNQNNLRRIYCQNQNENNNDRMSQYFWLDNHREDPLRQPEETVNLDERTMLLPVQPIEEPEEDIFNDDEADVTMQDGNTDSEEQVVPSSQLSSSYKYPEELTVSEDEIDEGIFEDDLTTYDIAVTDNNTRYDSQPP